MLWNPFRVRPIATNNFFPGWRGVAADPGLRCATPSGYSPDSNQTCLAKLGTTEFQSTNAKRLLNKLVWGHLRLEFVICFEFRASDFPISEKLTDKNRTLLLEIDSSLFDLR